MYISWSLPLRAEVEPSTLKSWLRPPGRSAGWSAISGGEVENIHGSRPARRFQRFKSQEHQPPFPDYRMGNPSSQPAPSPCLYPKKGCNPTLHGSSWISRSCHLRCSGQGTETCGEVVRANTTCAGAMNDGMMDICWEIWWLGDESMKWSKACWWINSASEWMISWGTLTKVTKDISLPRESKGHNHHTQACMISHQFQWLLENIPSWAGNKPTKIPPVHQLIHPSPLN